MLAIALARRRLGVGRRRRADPLQPLWGAGFQPRPGGHRHPLGRGRFGLIIGGSWPIGWAHVCRSTPTSARSRSAIWCMVGRMCSSASRELSCGAVLDWRLARRRGGELRAELVAPAAPCGRRVRGRVFATNESLDLGDDDGVDDGRGLASQSVDPRAIGAVAGVVSSLTAVYWIWADRVGLLVAPGTRRTIRTMWRCAGKCARDHPTT